MAGDNLGTPRIRQRPAATMLAANNAIITPVTAPATRIKPLGGSTRMSALTVVTHAGPPDWSSPSDTSITLSADSSCVATRVMRAVEWGKAGSTKWPPSIVTGANPAGQSDA